MAIKISACTITKNEEKNLPSWLKCMQEVADEIIVVDTGSTDATVDIAQKAVGKVYHFKWINDFAAAKNYAIEQATGDWIMFLDADERFTQETQKKLHKELERFDKDKSVAALLCRLLDVNEDDELIETLIETAERLAKDVSRLNDIEFDENANIVRIAILYAVAYLYEHRENANHRNLTLTMRSMLFGVRKVMF